MPDSNGLGHCGVAEQVAELALAPKFRVLPHQAICGSADKDYWLYGIELVDSDHSELLPWNLPGRVL
jgi:hypothetical protein